MIAARIGAIDTDCWVPRGILTGRAEASRARTIQKATPARISKSDEAFGSPSRPIAIEALAGNTKVAARSAIALRATTPEIASFRDLGIEAPYV